MDDAELVERGSFRVDRARALDKLSRFQLGDPSFGLFFWVRCAAASGATRVEIEPGLTSLKVRFDGKPLTREELRDPYGALFAEDAPRRARHFAYALLWALRLSPGRLSVVSGDRLLLASEGPGSEELHDAPYPREGTELAVGGMWSSLLTRPWSPGAAELARALGTCPAEVLVSGERLGPRAPEDALAVELGAGRRAFLSVDPGARRSTAVVHVDGVAAGRFEYPPRWVPAFCLVEAPDLALDASQASAVRDARLDALLLELAGAERGLLEPLLDGELSADSPRAAAVRAASRLLLQDPDGDAKDALLARLWDAPLYRYSWGGPHTLREVAARPGMEKDLEGLDHQEWGELISFLGRLRRRA